MRFRCLLVGLSVLALMASCGGDDDDGLERSADVESPEDTSADPGPDAADGGDGEPAPDGADGADGTGGPTGDEPTDGSGETGGTDPTEPQGPVPNMASQDICDAVPAPVVADALGVGSVTSEPGGSAGTPQCSYGFEGADGVATEATVAVLRSEEDLDGREGEDAYDYTLALNRRAASGADFEEIPLSIGDEAVLFDGDDLRFGVIRYGRRIVTVIVTANAAGTDAARALAAATTPLAP